MSYFTALQRGSTRLGVAGMIRSPADAEAALAAGADWIMLGRAAIFNHNFPALYANNPGFVPPVLSVTRAQLIYEGLSDTFISYVKKGWPDYVLD